MAMLICMNNTNEVRLRGRLIVLIFDVENLRNLLLQNHTLLVRPFHRMMNID